MALVPAPAGLVAEFSRPQPVARSAWAEVVAFDDATGRPYVILPGAKAAKLAHELATERGWTFEGISRRITTSGPLSSDDAQR